MNGGERAVERDLGREPGHAIGRRIGPGWALLLFLAALLPRVGVALQYGAAHPFAEDPTIDEASYDAWGARIAEGEWLGDEVFFQEPLYPYTLGVVYAVFGHDRRAARLLQCGLGALTAVLVAVLGARTFGRAAGILAGAIAALYRPGWLFPSLLLKPSLFLPILAMIALVLLASRQGRARTAFALGVLAGLGALLRGNVLLLLPCFVLWPLARAMAVRAPIRGALLRAALVLAGALLVLLPVAARNHYVGGIFALTTSGAGTNVYGGNNAANPHGIATELDWVRGIPEHEAGDWRREAERRLGRALDPGEVSSYWLSQVLDSIQREPLLHLSILARKLRLTLGAYEVPDNHHLEWDARYLPLLRLPVGGFGVWGMLGLAGALLFALLRGRGAGVDRAAALELLALAALYVATIVLTVTSMRIRLALVPLLLPFAGFWLHTGWRLRRSPRGRARLASALAGSLALAALIVHTPVFGPEARAGDLDERDFNLAAARLGRGDTAGARRLARALDERYGGRSSRVLTLLSGCDFEEARALAARGQETDAAALADGAWARIAPLLELEELPVRERFRANVMAARIAIARRHWQAAAVTLRRALTFDPEDPALRIGLARTDFALARRALRDDDAAEDERAAARERVGAALAELEAVTAADDCPPERAVEARLLAAEFQLDPLLGNWTAAQNHLRAALRIDERNRAARGLLATALWRSGTGASAPERAEAEAILMQLLAEEESAELRELYEAVRK